MSGAFFDTSALLKLLLDEPGAAVAAETWRDANPRQCSRLAFVEARAALAAVHRGGRLDATRYRSARDAWAEFSEELNVIEVDEPLVEFAADIAESHGLRGYDAVHLAAALTVGAELFVSSDTDQLRAAATENLTVLDPAFVP